VPSNTITKPEEHETNRAGRRLLRAVLEPLGWVVNDVQEDYGIDCNVQVFDGKSPTGAWFHVQLKSSASPAYSSVGTFVSQELSAAHARYFACEMQDPIFLVIADTSLNVLYWHSPQLDEHLSAALVRTDVRSVRARVPTRQKLPDSAAEMLASLNRIYLVLSTRQLASAPAPSFADSLRHFADQTELFNAFQKKNDILRLRRVHQLYLQNQIPEARQRANSILDDADSDVETKFWAMMALRAIEFQQTLFDGKPEIESAKVMVAHARMFKRLTRSGPKHLKFYSAIVNQAAELDVRVHEYWGLFLAIKQHAAHPSNPLAMLGLAAQKSALMRRIFSNYNRCVRLARYAANYPDRWMLGRAMTQIVDSIAPFLIALRAEGVGSAVDFARSALQICRVAAWISNETNDAKGIVLAVLASLQTTRTTDSDAYRWAAETVNALRDPEARRDAELAVERVMKRWKGEEVEGDYKGDTLWQVIQNMSTSIGLDISNEGDPLVQGLRIAARDDSPERVLRTCEHIVVGHGAFGPTARRIKELFNIETAGSKVVHCSIHDHHQEGRDLDRAYAAFHRSFCESCPDSKPRAPEWRYKGDVRREFEQRHRAFVTRLYGTPYGFRFTKED
jgi:hypothetical protein